MDLTTVKPTTIKPTTVVPRTTVPLTELPKTILPTMEILKTVVPRTKVPRVSNDPLYEYNYNRTNQQVSPFSDYNDPTEINSFADVIWNTLSKNENLKTNDYGILSDVGDWNIPFLSQTARAITGTVDLIRNTTIDPILDRDFKALGINALMNFSETMDILANPVKGLIMDGPEGLIKGSVGRVNYDFDTGNWLLDMAGELVVDPFNWVSFGVAGIAKGMAKTAGTEILESAIDTATKKGIRILASNLEPTDALKASFKKIVGSNFVTSGGDIDKAILKTVNQMGGNKYFTNEFITVLQKQHLDILSEVQIRNLAIAKGLAHTVNASETIEEVLAQGSLAMNLIPVTTIKKLVTENPIWKNMSEHVSKAIYSSYQAVTGVDDVFNLINYQIAKNATPIVEDHITHILSKAGLETIGALDLDKAVTARALTNIENLNKILNAEELIPEKLFVPEILAEVSGNRVLLNELQEAITKNPEKSFDELLADLGTERSVLFQDINDIFAHNIKIIDELNKNNNGIFQNLKVEYTATTYRLSQTLQKYTDLKLFEETIEKTIKESIINRDTLSPEMLQNKIKQIRDLVKDKKYLEASLQDKPSQIKFSTDLDTYNSLKENCKVYLDNTVKIKGVSENPYAFKSINTTKFIAKPQEVLNKVYNPEAIQNLVRLTNSFKVSNTPVLRHSTERITPALKTLLDLKAKLDNGVDPFKMAGNRDRFIDAIFDLQREFTEIQSRQPSAISKDLEPFIKEIQSVDARGTSEAMLSADSATVVYQTKTEELYTLVNCFEPQLTEAGETIVDLNKTLDSISENKTAQYYLKSFTKLDSESISATAKSCESVINNLNNIRDFMQVFYRDPYIAIEHKNFYMSSLLKNKNIKGVTAVLNPEFIHRGVMKDFATFINSAQAVRKLNINSLLSESKKMLDLGNKAIVDNFNLLNDMDKQMFNKLALSGETHTALEDAYLTELIIRLRNPDEYVSQIVEGIPLNKLGKSIYISDLEATGLSASNSHITEIALKQMGADNSISFRLSYSEHTHNISEDILKSRYPKLDTETALKEYKEFYNPSNPANANIKFFDNEADMLQAYKDYLNSLDAGSDIIFHNGKAYDTPMLFDRASKYGMDFTTSPVYSAKDSLYDMRKLNFGYDISQIEEIKLWNYTEQYIKKLTVEDISMSFLNPLSSHNMDTIKNMIDIVKNSKPCAYTNSLLSSLSQLYSDLSTLKKSLTTANRNNTVFVKELLNTPQAQQVFIKQCQAKYIQNKQVLDNIDKIYTNPVQAAVEKASLERQQAGIKKTLQLAKVDELGNIQGVVNMNLVRMFYSYNMTSLPMQGYEKLIDLKLIKSYMDIPSDLLITITNRYGRQGFSWESFYDLVRDFPASYRTLNNLELLENQSGLIKENLIKLKELLSEENNIYKFVKTDNIDFKADYLMSEKLYQRALDMELNLTTLDPEFVTIIKESQVLKNSYDSEEAIQKAIASIEKGIDSEELPVQAWLDLLDEDLNNVTEYSENILRKLSTDKTYSNFTNTRTQELLTLAGPVQKSFDSLKQYLNTLSDTDKLKVIQAVRRSNDFNQYKAVKQLLEQSPEDLLVDLYTKSMVVVYDTSFMNSMDGGELTKLVRDRIKEFSDKGIKVIENEDLNLMFIVPSKDNSFKSIIDPSNNESLYELNGNAIIPNQAKEIIQSDSLRGKLPDNIVDDLIKGQESMIRITDGYAAGSLYEVTNTGWYKTLYERLPKEVQNELGDVSTYTSPALFNGRSRYNMSVFGSYETRSKFTDFTTNSFIKNFANTFRTVGKNATGKCHAIDFMVNSGTSINEGIIGDLLKAEKYDDVLKTFENAPESVLGALVYNESTGYKLIEIKPTSKANLIQAQKFDAKIMDYHVFSTMFSVINSNTFSDSSPILETYSKLLRTFKLGYLVSTGYTLRNAIDTFGKNIIEANGNIIETAKYTYNAFKMYNDYDKVIVEIINTSPNKILSKENIQNYFKTMNPIMSYEDWSFVHDILNEGAFVGEVKSLDLYREFRKQVKNQDIPDEELQGLFETYRHAYRTLNPVDGFMSINSAIEDGQRLASYLMMRDKGMNFAEAVAKTAYNHFDYSVKTAVQKALELVFPFYTFKMRNINYWLNVLSENGWLAGMLRDVMTPIWDFDDASYYELSNNQSLQSRILSGNIQILDSGVTFKINPSVSDALKFVTDPFGEAYNSLFTPIQILLEAGLTLTPDSTIKQSVKDVFNIYDSKNQTAFDTVYNLLNFVPFGSSVQRFMMGYKYSQETQNILPMLVPSVFGRVKRFDERTYSYNYREYPKYGSSYKKSSYRKVAKPRKTYPKRTYNRYSNPYNRPYPINFKKIYIDGMYTVPNISTYVAKANRLYNYPRLSQLPTVSIYDKLYTSKGKSRWDAMLQTVTPKNLKYVIKQTIHYK